MRKKTDFSKLMKNPKILVNRKGKKQEENQL